MRVYRRGLVAVGGRVIGGSSERFGNVLLAVVCDVTARIAFSGAPSGRVALIDPPIAHQPVSLR